jgi:ArsR family transcriptional regulator, virulence genes transcriptional regulator
MSENKHRELMEHPEVCHVVRDFIAHFANPLRLRILCGLSDGPATVKELVELTGARQPAVSQQLNLLRLAGVVSRTREGNKSVYEISEPLAAEMMDFIVSIADQLIERHGGGASERECVER